MENLSFEFNANKKIKSKAHVGVVSSGNMELLLFPTEANKSKVKITTKIDNNAEIWRKILNEFFIETNCLADIIINDGGASPGMVNLRLQQALEVANNA